MPHAGTIKVNKGVKVLKLFHRLSYYSYVVYGGLIIGLLWSASIKPYATSAAMRQMFPVACGR